ncbi:acyl carrier protein, partial [Streptomyces sp. SID7982]|nr:acyl carrier protein [Streptomyces sp. SID7982]
LLGRPAEGVRPDLTLREQGLDSLMVVELRNRIGARTRVPLPTVLAFDYPTPQAIASLLLTHVDARYETP